MHKYAFLSHHQAFASQLSLSINMWVPQEYVQEYVLNKIFIPTLCISYVLPNESMSRFAKGNVSYLGALLAAYKKRISMSLKQLFKWTECLSGTNQMSQVDSQVKIKGIEGIIGFVTETPAGQWHIWQDNPSYISLCSG